MLEITFLNDNSKMQFDLERCSKGFGGELFKFGGQGRVYRCMLQHQGKPLDLALKVMPDSIPGTAEVFRRLRGIRNSVIRLGGPNDPTYLGVTYRGLPVAQGSARAEDFGFDGGRTNTVYMLAFNFVDGPLLTDYLRGEDPLSPKRIRAAKQLLDILIFLQNHGVVHSDLYPDNFMVDRQGKVCVLDLEGAGIKTASGNWDFKPVVTGKTYLWPLPPEVEGFGGTPTFQSDIWVGAYLIFETLTGFKPLDFMLRMDREALEDLCQAATSTPCWPPEVRSLRFANPDFPLSEMRRFMDYYFKDTCFGGLLFATYVVGWKTPPARPAFPIFKTALSHIL